MNKEFIEYEYKNMYLKKDTVDMYSDNIKFFGWEVTSVNRKNDNNIQMQLKRNRNISNREELSRLENKFNALMLKISKLRKKEIWPAIISSSLIGIIGFLIMAISVFFFKIYGLIPSLLIAIPGVICFFGIYFVYFKINSSLSMQLDPEIYKNIDILYDVCQRAHNLILNKKDA